MQPRLALVLSLLLITSAYADKTDSTPQLEKIQAPGIDHDAVGAQTPYLSTPRKFIAFAPSSRTSQAAAREPNSPRGDRAPSRWARAKEKTLQCANMKVTNFSGYGRIVGVTIGASAGVVIASPTFIGTASGALGGALGGALVGDIIGRAAGFSGCATYHYAREAVRRSP